jgi:glycerol uptake facilitator-like aquaporin
MPVDISRRLVAEALGSCLLVASVIGSGIMAEQLAGGNAAVALLGNTLATGAMLFVLITIFAPLSGAHFNPAVSFIFWLRGELALSLAAFYIVMQFAGALLGAALAHFMFDLPLVQHGAHMRAGMGQLAGEGVATFMLIAAILGAQLHARHSIALVVALTIVAGYWFTSSTSFANPAVTLARAFTDSFSGIRLIDAPGFMAAQIIGALVALVVMSWLNLRVAGGDENRKL